MEELQSKSLGLVDQYPDRSVACPICQQEFWGYSEIIFCSCGWTFIREEEVAQASFKTLREPAFVTNYLPPRRADHQPAKARTKAWKPVIAAKPQKS